ncbi:MAG: ATP-dependent RNA helicase RhlE [Methylococcus sp.]|nr:MAG: ATP-dependent RNA helicase RhlE [Methylococcus sp.]
MTFNNLGLIEPILRAVEEKGYSTPSPIQLATIPVVLEGKDLMASAQTGTGKTAAFVLPMLQQLNGRQRVQGGRARVLIITPTRELAAQIQANIQTYGKHLNVSSAVVFGGVNVNPQIKQLRRGVDILVATPGRLLDLFQQKAIRFDSIEALVLDEADRMLDMGFIPDIRRIQSLLPKNKQSLLFSATFSDEIRKLARTMLHQPAEIDVAPRNTTVERIRQRIHPVDKSRKTQLLSHLIRENQWVQVLVFSRTKHGANRLVKELGKANIRAVAIHGNKSQAQRTRALADFKHGKVDVMVATDIAARGIDIVQLPHVINFDLPNVPEDYVHRIGRTGRAGNEGEAISLVSADETKQLRDIERLIKRNLERQEVEGFEPGHQLPASRPVGLEKKSRNNRKPEAHGKWGTKSGYRNRGNQADPKPRSKKTGVAPAWNASENQRAVS